ncbi:hypothetical protein J6590_026363 [Homalodisca vitripennis]|nr:hypothetical protein J6590_026363 [Homalodisca vitripennis]
MDREYVGQLIPLLQIQLSQFGRRAPPSIVFLSESADKPIQVLPEESSSASLDGVQNCEFLPTLSACKSMDTPVTHSCVRPENTTCCLWAVRVPVV